MKKKYCKICKKQLTNLDIEISTKYHYGNICKKCHNKYQRNWHHKKKWQQLQGKPKPYYKGKIMSSNIMNKDNCHQIIEMITPKNFKSGKGTKIIIYKGKDNFFHVQMI